MENIKNNPQFLPANLCRLRVLYSGSNEMSTTIIFLCLYISLVIIQIFFKRPTPTLIVLLQHNRGLGLVLGDIPVVREKEIL